MTRRESSTAFAARIGKSPFTVRKMCRDGKLIARRVGRDWQIDADASEKLLSLKYGNAAERDLARKR